MSHTTRGPGITCVQVWSCAQNEAGQYSYNGLYGCFETTSRFDSSSQRYRSQKAVLVKHLCSHTFAKDDVHEKAL